MSMAVNVICRNYQEDRVIPRFSRYLSAYLGWTLTAKPIAGADVYYLSGYFEESFMRPWPDKPVAAYFTHRETEPPGNAKSALFDRIGEKIDLRIVTAAMYARELQKYGPTVQITPPVEREHFTIPPRRNRGIVAGFSGYTYSNKRKGEDMARAVPLSKTGRQIAWKASGRGWPVPTRRYAWSEMPAFYQSLDILVVTARVEGVPMPPLECLACGVSVVVPRSVGLMDELPDTPGIHRYACGSVGDCVRALSEAVEMRSSVDRERLRAVTEPYTIEGWCQAHAQTFESLQHGQSLTITKEPVLKQTLTAEDGIISNSIRKEYPEVDAVLKWTARHIPYIKRQIAPYQGAFLAYCAHHYDRAGAKILEIGTALGYSACLMATAAPKSQITTLNPKDGEFEKARDNLAIRSTVRVVKSTSQDLWKAPVHERYDLIFVDGDHSYNVVLHDAQFFNLLSPGGLILFHDYSPETSARPSAGSFQALNDLQEKYRPADVLVVGSGQVGMLGWIRQEGEIWA